MYFLKKEPDEVLLMHKIGTDLHVVVRQKHKWKYFASNNVSSENNIT